MSFWLVQNQTTRITYLTTIMAKMHKNEWLTATENQWLNGDETLGREQQELSKKLNSYTE